MKRNKNTV